MDPFSKLPPELNAEILANLNREDLVPVCQALPIFNAVVKANHFHIAREHTLRDLHGDLLQDALAIIHFPTFGFDDIHTHSDHRTSDPANDLKYPVPETVTMNHRSAATDAHLRKWGAKNFSDPFSSHDIETIMNLDSLCRQVWLHAREYIYRATRNHLPKAYRLLPAWSHHTLTSSPSQKKLREGLTQDEVPFPFHNLTVSQRHRTMQAFLRYELICMIFRPIVGPGFSRRCCPYCQNASKPWKHDRFGPFRCWNWDILSHYRGTTLWDPEGTEAMACVREYIQCMYASLMATESGEEAPLAHSFTDSIMDLYRPQCSAGIIAEHVPGVVGPTFVRDDPATQFARTSQTDEATLSLLPTCGLGLLTNSLQRSVADFRKMVKSMRREMRRHRERIQPTSILGLVRDTDFTLWHVGDNPRRRRQRAAPLFCEVGDFRTSMMRQSTLGRLMYGMGTVGMNLIMKVAAYNHNPNIWSANHINEAIVHGAHRAFDALQGRMLEVWRVPLPEGECWAGTD